MTITLKIIPGATRQVNILPNSTLGDAIQAANFASDTSRLTWTYNGSKISNDTILKDGSFIKGSKNEDSGLV